MTPAPRMGDRTEESGAARARRPRPLCPGVARGFTVGSGAAGGARGGMMSRVISRSPVMRNPPLAALFALIVVALAHTAPAAPNKKQPEELSYTPPAGWERTENERI